MKRLLLLVSLVLSTASVNSVYAENDMDPNIGKHLYKSYCLVCHGPSGKGDGPLSKKKGIQPVDLSSPKYQQKNIDELEKIIGFYGRKEGSKMPQWKDAVPEANIKHIAAYIKRLSRTSIKLAGDDRRGREIFKSACVACHGTHGKGDGILAELINIKMIDFTDQATMGKVSDQQMLNSIHDGKGDFMPPWDGTLNENEIVDVAAYVRSLGRAGQ